MKPLAAPRRVPPGQNGPTGRYVVLDVPGRGPHAFRFPTYGRCSELIQFVQSAPPAPESVDGKWRLDDPAWAAFQVGEDQTDGALLGVCWWHESAEVEASREGRDLAEYGESVVNELVDHGYRQAEYHALAVALYLRLIEFHNAGRAMHHEARAEGNVSPAPGPTSLT